MIPHPACSFAPFRCILIQRHWQIALRNVIFDRLWTTPAVLDIGFGSRCCERSYKTRLGVVLRFDNSSKSGGAVRSRGDLLDFNIMATFEFKATSYRIKFGIGHTWPNRKLFCKAHTWAECLQFVSILVLFVWSGVFGLLVFLRGRCRAPQPQRKRAPRKWHVWWQTCTCREWHVWWQVTSRKRRICCIQTIWGVKAEWRCAPCNHHTERQYPVCGLQIRTSQCAMASIENFAGTLLGRGIQNVFTWEQGSSAMAASGTGSMFWRLFHSFPTAKGCFERRAVIWDCQTRLPTYCLTCNITLDCTTAKPQTSTWGTQ